MPPKKQIASTEALLKIAEKRKKCIQKYRNNLTKKRQSNKNQYVIEPVITATSTANEISTQTNVLVPEIYQDKPKLVVHPRCPKGTRRNKKTGECEPVPEDKTENKKEKTNKK
jgi:hypothetical protein